MNANDRLIDNLTVVQAVTDREIEVVRVEPDGTKLLRVGDVEIERRRKFGKLIVEVRWPSSQHAGVEAAAKHLARMARALEIARCDQLLCDQEEEARDLKLPDGTELQDPGTPRPDPDDAVDEKSSPAGW